MYKKKYVVFFSALSMAVSAPVFANPVSPAPSSQDSAYISIPSLNPGFNMGVAALWLRPGASNLTYVIYNRALPLLQPSWSEQELNPAFSPAFEIQMGYVPKNSGGMDIDLDWTHLRSETVTESIAAATSSDFLGPDYDIGPDGSNIRNATGSAQFSADVINVDAGQHVLFGRRLNIRFFGGLSTGFLKENLTDTYSGTATAVAASGSIPATAAGPFSVTQYESSRFSGAGPRIGVDANYRMRCGFGFIGEGAITALFGTMASNTNYLGTSQTLINNGYAVPNPQYIADQHVFQVIPGFDTKLGVDYKRALSQTTTLVVSTGYQAAVYINAISQYLPGSLVQTKGLSTGSLYVETMNHILSNYSMQGPFLKLSLEF